MFKTELKSFEGSDFKLNKENILKHVTEEEIFFKYLNIVPSSKPIKSPIRQDKHPSCGFYTNDYGIIKFYDKAKSINEDCFGIVKLLFKVDYNKALTIIAEDFGLINKTYTDSFPYREKMHSVDDLVAQTTVIQIQTRPFSKKDLDWWKLFNINEELLKQGKCYAVKTAWINGNIHYLDSYNDPCYAYCFKENKTIKLYFPLRDRSKLRFYGMSNLFPISGYSNLPTVGDWLLITKSWKDEHCIKSFGYKTVCSIQSENGVINKKLITDLYNRFDNILTLFDYDNSGIRVTKINKEKYDFLKPLFIKDVKAKDYSGYFKLYGIDKTIELNNKFEEYIQQFTY